MAKMTHSNLRPEALVAALLALGLGTAPAQALSNRAWVSGHGSDAMGCGAPASPCRTFQYVHDNIIAAGGEIDVLDPAGFGAVTITKGLSIVNDGVGTAGVQAASGNAITSMPDRAMPSFCAASISTGSAPATTASSSTPAAASPSPIA
jgi:hypothetical protein